MMLSKVLCDHLHEQNRAAHNADHYAIAFVYSTAEDLADGMLKGKAYSEALPALLAAYSRNAGLAEYEYERDAWENAGRIARSVADEYSA